MREPGESEPLGSGGEVGGLPLQEFQGLDKAQKAERLKRGRMTALSCLPEMRLFPSGGSVGRETGSREREEGVFIISPWKLK